MGTAMVESQVRDLLERLGLHDARFVSNSSGCRVQLPPASGADYSFWLHLRDSGEHQISAKPVHDIDSESMFWFMPFELPDFHHSVEELAEAYLQAVEVALTHETKILQKRGWLFWYFECRYRVGETAMYLYSMRIRRGLPVRPIRGKHQILSSAALSSRSAGVHELRKSPGAWLVLAHRGGGETR